MATLINNSKMSVTVIDKELLQPNESSPLIVKDKAYKVITQQPKSRCPSTCDSLFIASPLPLKPPGYIYDEVSEHEKISLYSLTIVPCAVSCIFTNSLAGDMFSKSIGYWYLPVLSGIGFSSGLCFLASGIWLIFGYHCAKQCLKPTQQFDQFIQMTDKIISELNKQDEEDQKNGIPEELCDPITIANSLRDPVGFIEDTVNLYSARAIINHYQASGSHSFHLLTNSTINLEQLEQYLQEKPAYTEPQQIKVMLFKKAFFKFDQSVACKKAGDISQCQQHKTELNNLIDKINNVTATDGWNSWLKKNEDIDIYQYPSASFSTRKID